MIHDFLTQLQDEALKVDVCLTPGLSHRYDIQTDHTIWTLDLFMTKGELEAQHIIEILVTREQELSFNHEKYRLYADFVLNIKMKF